MAEHSLEKDDVLDHFAQQQNSKALCHVICYVVNLAQTGSYRSTLPPLAIVICNEILCFPGLRLCVQFASSLADSALWVSLVGLAWIYWWSLGVGGSGGGGVGGSLWGTPAAEDMGGGPGRLVLRVTRTGDGVSKVFPAGSMR